MGKWPSGQKQLIVNQPGKPYSGSNPLLPTIKEIIKSLTTPTGKPMGFLLPTGGC